MSSIGKTLVAACSSPADAEVAAMEEAAGAAGSVVVAVAGAVAAVDAAASVVAAAAAAGSASDSVHRVRVRWLRDRVRWLRGWRVLRILGSVPLVLSPRPNGRLHQG